MASFDASRSEDKLVILRRVPVFAGCTDEQLHVIAQASRLVEYKKGELVYQQGGPAQAFYIISSGRVRVSRAEAGAEQLLVVLHGGDSFGEMSLLAGELHSASVQALNDTLILELAKADFEEVINRVPALVLHLSRLLSRRLRSRQVGADFAEATLLAIYSAARDVGRTLFAATLAAALRGETGEPVVLVDFAGEEAHPWLGAAGGTQSRTLVAASEELVEAAIRRHPLGFDVLWAKDLLTSAGGEQAIAPLLTTLTKRFRYILIDLPPDLSPPVMKALTQSDVVYLITTPAREHVVRTSALMRRLQASLGALEQRVKVILNRRDGSEQPLSPEEVATQLAHPIASILPHLPDAEVGLSAGAWQERMASRSSPYLSAVRHCARELGGLLVGLALGSGAALGLAHIGVLKVIERERLPIDIVAGSSIGALVAGLWASGRPAADLERIALEFKNPWDIRQLFILDFGIPVTGLLIGFAAGLGVGMLAGFWTGLLFGFIACVSYGVVFGPLVGGPIQGARLMARLERDFAGKTFEETWLPLKIVAANPIAREEVVFEAGPIAPAVRASVSIPGIFKPVIVKGKICLDGGVVNPIPVSVLKRAGAHHVIAVNVFPTTEELAAHRQERARRRAERDAALGARSLPIRLFYRIRQELIRSMSPLIFDVIMRSMQSMEYQIAEVACRAADLTLRPTVAGSTWLEFHQPEKFIRRGEEVALQYLPELKRITHGRIVDNP